MRANIPHSVKAQLESIVSESNVKSVSDYLFELIEKHIEERELEQQVNSIRVSKQRLGARAGRN